MARFSLMSLLKVAVALPVLVAVAAGPALAETAAEADQNATGRKKEEVRKQKTGLLPPKEALEQKDADVAPDAYQPKGVDLGQFLLLPKMEVDLIRNSNIFAQNYGPKHDFIQTYRPEILLNSRFDRHALNAAVRGERKEFARYQRESVSNGFAQLNGRYDMGERDNLNANISYVHDHEDRGSPDDAGGIRPTEFHYLTLNTSAAVNTGKITSILGFSAVRRDWEDTVTSVGITPSHFRNRDEFEVKLREGYEIIPGYSWIVEGSALQRRYMHKFDQTGTKRDSDGLRVGTGVALDVSELIRGDFIAGYMRQDYADRSLRDPSGYYLKAMFNWMPTKLTTVIPSAERAVEESTANGVSALVRTSTSVTVRHELERNLILGSTLSFSRDVQEGGRLHANTYEGMARATYLFDRNFFAMIEGGQRQKVTNVDGNGFAQTIGMLRFGAQY